MNRRSFIKRAGALLGICYVNPLNLIPTVNGGIVSNASSNHFIHPNQMASEALAHLEADLTFPLSHFSKEFIEPAMNKLADNIDHDLLIAMKGK